MYWAHTITEEQRIIVCDGQGQRYKIPERYDATVIPIKADGKGRWQNSELKLFRLCIILYSAPLVQTVPFAAKQNTNISDVNRMCNDNKRFEISLNTEF